jgi:uncharacterized membrane protein
MLYLWVFIFGILAAVLLISALLTFVGGKFILALILFVLGALSAAIAVTAYYARERVNSVREFFGWA